MKSAWRRLAAFSLDWIVIAGWGLILFGIVIFLSGGNPRAPSGPISFRQAMITNTIKFAPWEAGHLVAQQALYSSGGGPAPWVWLFVLVSMAGPIWWLMGVFSSHHTFYDRVAGTRVTLS